MQFKVVIPDQCAAGQTIRIHIRDGTEANVKIPNGLVSGDSFIFELPTNQMQNPQVLILQQQQQQQESMRRQAATTTTTGDNINNNNAVPHAISEIETGYTSNNDDNDDNNNNTNTNSNLITTTASIINGDNKSDQQQQQQQQQLPRQKSRQTGALFLEREVLDFQDFFLALSVGLLVGSAIVIGFLLGILHVTADIYASHPIEKPKCSTSSSSSSSRRNINEAANGGTVPVSSPIGDNNHNNNDNPFPIAEANTDDGSSVDGIQMINEALDLLSQ